MRAVSMVVGVLSGFGAVMAYRILGSSSAWACALTGAATIVVLMMAIGARRVTRGFREWETKAAPEEALAGAAVRDMEAALAPHGFRLAAPAWETAGFGLSSLTVLFTDDESLFTWSRSMGRRKWKPAL